jgi:choline dehydrogenase-like flavoprotein
MTHDVIVVGSGSAGGVTAARLAEREMRVLVLGRGVWRGSAGLEDDARQPRRAFARGLTGMLRDVRSVRIARRGAAREVMLNPRGLWEIHRLGGVNALTVSGVGGGSLVYLLLVAPEDVPTRASNGGQGHVPAEGHPARAGRDTDQPAHHRHMASEPVLYSVQPFSIDVQKAAANRSTSQGSALLPFQVVQVCRQA